MLKYEQITFCQGSEVSSLPPWSLLSFGKFSVDVVASKISNYSGKRLFEMMADGQDNTLSQAAEQYENEEVVSDNGLSQST